MPPREPDHSTRGICTGLDASPHLRASAISRFCRHRRATSWQRAACSCWCALPPTPLRSRLRVRCPLLVASQTRGRGSRTRQRMVLSAQLQGDEIAREERAAVAVADTTRSRMAGCARERARRGRPRRRTGGRRSAGRRGAGLRRRKRRGVARGADKGGHSSGGSRPCRATATMRTSARAGPAVCAMTTNETIITQCIVTFFIILTKHHVTQSIATI